MQLYWGSSVQKVTCTWEPIIIVSNFVLSSSLYTSGSFKTSQNESDAVSKLLSFTLDTIGKHECEALITMPLCTSIGNLVNIAELLLWYKVKKFRFQATFVVTTSIYISLHSMVRGVHEAPSILLQVAH